MLPQTPNSGTSAFLNQQKLWNLKYEPNRVEAMKQKLAKCPYLSEQMVQKGKQKWREQLKKDEQAQDINWSALEPPEFEELDVWGTRALIFYLKNRKSFQSDSESVPKCFPLDGNLSLLEINNIGTIQWTYYQTPGPKDESFMRELDKKEHNELENKKQYFLNELNDHSKIIKINDLANFEQMGLLSLNRIQISEFGKNCLLKLLATKDEEVRKFANKIAAKYNCSQQPELCEAIKGSDILDCMQQIQDFDFYNSATQTKLIAKIELLGKLKASNAVDLLLEILANKAKFPEFQEYDQLLETTIDSIISLSQNSNKSNIEKKCDDTKLNYQERVLANPLFVGNHRWQNAIEQLCKLKDYEASIAVMRKSLKKNSSSFLAKISWFCCTNNKNSLHLAKLQESISVLEKRRGG